MSEKEMPTHTMPGGQQENSEADDGVVNDSLGKIDTADTTGTGEDNQPCERRKGPVPEASTNQEDSSRRRNSK